MRRYGTLQVVPSQVQLCNPLKHGIACYSMPVTKVSGSIPREQDSIRIIGYEFPEFEQCQMIV